MAEKIPVALAKCADYAQPGLARLVGDLLDATAFQAASGSRILVKPNLLCAKPLACASPQIVAAVCQWLLDRNCKIRISDSPAFGSPQKVARQIGLEDVLRPLGLRVSAFHSTSMVSVDIQGKLLRPGIAREALESDAIFSIARVKAHSQMRITLCVKNCYGTVPGLRKAFLHALYGKDQNFFAKLLISIWRSLPPVFAVADGICAMHKTGPIKGEPFQLGLLGASSAAPLLDLAILRILKLQPDYIPLANCLSRQNAPTLEQATWPLCAAEDFNIEGFIVPETLKSASFSPLQLARSCLMRCWKQLHS